MALRGVTLSALVLLSLLAGCADGPESVDEPVDTVAPDARMLPPVLAATSALDAPGFALTPAVATGFMGEPTLIADAKGTMFLTFPGCPDGRECANGLVLRSDDDGAQWRVLNPLENGSLAEDSPAANGDAMVSLDAAGTLYASNLGGGTPVWASTDGGTTWELRGDPVPEDAGSDRQWAWAGPADFLAHAWMATAPSRSAAVAVSVDGGRNWTEPSLWDDPIGWIGPIVGSDDGVHLAAPYTKPLNTNTLDDPSGVVNDLALLMADPEVDLRVLLSDDAGASWRSQSIGHVVTKNPASTQWPGTLMAPAIGRTGAGDLVYGWSEQTLDPALRAAGSSAAVYAMVSPDEGATWGEPRLLSGTRTAIMPWVVGGAGHRYAVAWYGSSDARLDNNYEGTWDVEAVVVDGDDLVTSIVAPTVHTGGICAQGGTCLLRGADRSMLDFLGGTLLPDGRVAWAYASSAGLPGPAAPIGRATSIHVAVQSSGARLV